MDINENNIINFSDAFSSISNTSTSKDCERLNAMIDEIMQYDVFDFIARVSSLNLIIENQNKSILFDTLIAGILTRPRENYTSKQKMSSGKFRNMMEQLAIFDLSRLIDPTENAFIERVRYYGNFWIFPGINYEPAYTIQNFINILCRRDNRYNEKFLYEANLLINFVLQISSEIANNLGYNISTLEHKEIQRISIPDSTVLNKLKACVYFGFDSIKETLCNLSLISILHTDFGHGTLEDVLKEDKQRFFVNPFLSVNENQVILLNPSILASFAIHQIVLLADQYDMKSDLINDYNNEVWNDCRKSLRRLGHKKIREQDLDIKLLNTEEYKEAILNVENDGLLIVHFFCDDGNKYSEQSMFDIYKRENGNPTYSERIDYFLEKLAVQPPAHLYQLFILNSFGRRISAIISSREINSSISVNPFELFCISINEKSQDAFIPRYISAKEKLNTMPQMAISELNSIEIYTSNDYSFYVNDDFNPKAGTFFIAPGDSIDYVLRAIKQEDRQLVESYDGEHLLEVVLCDEKREIYSTVNVSSTDTELVIKFKKMNIWITTPPASNKMELNIYFSISDAISFWLSECADIINRLEFNTSLFNIQIVITGERKSYGLHIKDTGCFEDFVDYSGDSSTIIMSWTPAAFRFMNSVSNKNEKEMMASIFKQFEARSKYNFNWELFDKVFDNPLKKKFFSLDYITTPYLRPIHGHIQKIRAEDENQLLDEIGTHFLATDEWNYGRVPDGLRASLANQVVGYLYSLLQEMIAAVKPDGLFEIVCFDLEKIMYNLMLSHKRYAYDVACYPEKEKKFQQEHNELNKSSQALKFLAEYIAACPPCGTAILGKMQYENMIATCSLIINWAYRNDLFYYHIFNSPIEFLQSGRIGMKQDENDFLIRINASARARKLESLSDPSIDCYFPHSIIPELQSRVDEAFYDEYVFTFQQFTQCIMGMIECGDEIAGEVKKTSKQVLVRKLFSKEHIPEDIIERVLDQITLSKRDNYLTPPSPYTSLDVYPWRFNRELSFTRRPVMCVDNNLIWGNRQLYHMWTYTIDLIVEGKYKAKGKKLKALIGILSDKRGNEFNAVVIEKLKSIGGLLVDGPLSKINGKRLINADGNELGDIDVLYVIPKLRKIVVGEVKDFSYAKNPYEMDQEYQRLFVDTKKPCYISRHKRRVEWVKNHVEDVKAHFQLLGEKWVVKDTLFVSDEIVSNAFYNKGQKIIVYSEITEKSIKSV